ncbi:MAG: fumarate hydratase [Candidatus Omnitrophica bacterium]|nr:fumarate hydratase [Candidatus Omnitrophota bacterium]
MRVISAAKVEEAVGSLFLKANTVIRPDIKRALKRAYAKETNKLAGELYRIILENAAIAKTKRLPICQDTGLPVVFVEAGEDVRIKGGGLEGVIQKAVIRSYKKYLFRASIVSDPLKRESRSGFGPAIIHLELKKGKRLKITVMPKGFGSENKTRMKMFNPTVRITEIENFIVECVKNAGSDACPPYIVGVGVGGTAEKANLLAKMALLRPVDKNSRKKHILKMEKKIYSMINHLRIGPMGLGGKTTCLGVNILTYPTHIAGLPVAVNIGCHATRSAAVTI